METITGVQRPAELLIGDERDIREPAGLASCNAAAEV
jgi:hypothetical protein